MPANIKNYGEIQRVVDENRKWYGYYARLKHDGQTYAKFFSAKSTKMKDMDEARMQAVDYREELIEQLGIR